MRELPTAGSWLTEILAVMGSSHAAFCVHMLPCIIVNTAGLVFGESYTRSQMSTYLINRMEKGAESFAVSIISTSKPRDFQILSDR